MTAVVVVAHGSREPAANAEQEALVGAWAATRPELDISLGYLELAKPTLEDALTAAAGRSSRVVVLPLFFFLAGHAKTDLPLALTHARARHPAVHFAAARPLGVHPLLVELVWARASTVEPDAQTALVIVGRGASDPDANGDFVKLVRLCGEGRSLLCCHPTFIGLTRPLVGDTLVEVARRRPRRVVVVPLFFAAGRLMERLRASCATFATHHPWITTEVVPPLGAAPELFRLLDERLTEVDDGPRPLACDGCQYRVALAGRAHEVGGLSALLFSVRHRFTHAQATPHRHAHRPLHKHVLVCGNADCADRGAIALYEALRRLVKGTGRAIRVTRTSCLGRCGEGPTVAVYPDGVWYRGLCAADAPELVREHLLGDRLLSRAVDNIMQ